MEVANKKDLVHSKKSRALAYTEHWADHSNCEWCIPKQKVAGSLDEEALWWVQQNNIPDHINKTEIALLIIKSVRDKLGLEEKEMKGDE